MSDRRRDAATATVGALGVGGAAALRHEALVRAHNERATPWSRPENQRVERKRVLSERRLLRTRKGRGTYLAGAGLGLVALPALATGTHGLIHTSKRDSERRGFLREGWAGAKEAAIERTDTVKEGAPKKLVLGNYAAGLGVGSVAGGLTHAALRKTRIPQHGKSAIAAVTAGVTGTAALPLQSKLTNRASHGKYEVTPTGVRRLKTRPRRASSKATVVDGRSMDPRAFRAQTVAKARRWPGPKPFKPVATGLFEGTPSEDMVRLQAAAAKSSKKRSRAAEMRRIAMEQAAKEREVGKALRVRIVETGPPPPLHAHVQGKLGRRLRSRYSGVGSGITSGLGGGGYMTTTPGDVAGAYVQRGFKTSSGAPRKLRRKEFDAAVAETRRQRGPTLHERMVERDQYRISKMSPRTAVRRARRVHNDVGARVGAHWTVQGLRAADVIDVPNRAVLPATRRGKLVYTGRTKASSLVRQAALDVGSINDKDAMARTAINGHPLIGKRDDIGASMSRGERRARIAASGPPIPIVGDLMQARTAGRLSPEKYRHRTSAQNFGAGQAGGFAGNAAGAGIALGAARLSPGFERRAKATNDRVDEFTGAIKTKAFRAVGKEPGKGPGLASRALAHQRTPEAVRQASAKVIGSKAGRAVAHNPKVAAIGALVGGSIGAPAAQQAMLGHTMSRDDRYRRSLAKRQAEAVRDRPGPKPIPLSRREQESLRRRKNRSAALSVMGGTTGLSALGATLGHAAIARNPKLVARIPKTTKALKDVQVPLLTAGAGLGGYNAFNYAAIQHKEASQVRKGVGHLPPKGHLVLMSGDWSVAMNPAARDYPRRRLVLDRIEHMRRRNRKAIPQQRSTRVGEEGYYEYQPGGRVSKALVPRIPGVRRAPSVRRGFLRQTRYPSGMIRTSSVRGGLA